MGRQEGYVGVMKKLLVVFLLDSCSSHTWIKSDTVASWSRNILFLVFLVILSPKVTFESVSMWSKEGAN